ncbi:MAG: hypothetical protein ACRDXX_21845, partial [Stackebrandtia sp.]
PRQQKKSGKKGWWIGLGLLVVYIAYQLGAFTPIFDLAVDSLPDTDDGGAESGPSDEPITAAEFYADKESSYEIILEDRTLEGELFLLDSFDHDCASGAADAAAEQAMEGCTHRIEAVYRAGDERLRVSQQVLMFDDPAGAEAFETEFADVFAAEVLDFADPGDLEASGYAASRIGSEGYCVVMTMVVGDETLDSDDEADVQAAEDHSHFRHAESMSYLIWR